MIIATTASSTIIGSHSCSSSGTSTSTTRLLRCCRYHRYYRRPLTTNTISALGLISALVLSLSPFASTIRTASSFSLNMVASKSKANNKNNSAAPQKKLVVHWFRHGDLRLHDNPALVESVKAANSNHSSGSGAAAPKKVVGASPVSSSDASAACVVTNSFLPIMCVDPRLCGGNVTTSPFGTLKMSPRRAQFLMESVQDLRLNLGQTLATDLLVAYETPEAVFGALAKQIKLDGVYGSIEVYCQDEPCSEERAVVKGVGAALKTNNNKNKVTPIWGSTMYDPNDLPFEGGPLGMTDVYTPFRNKVEKACTIGKPLPVPTLKNNYKPTEDITLKDLIAKVASASDTHSTCRSTSLMPTLVDMHYTKDQQEEAATQKHDARGVMVFQGGESAALARVKDYIWTKDLLKAYFDTRNGMLGADYSTKFSPWLALGCLSPRHVAQQCSLYEQQRVANKSTYWVVFELLWRDYWKFFCVKHGNKVFSLDGTVGKDQNAGAKKWSFDAKSFEKFVSGRTGYPLVDANMRELAATGFMSNRGRQNVASFLALDMRMDWRYGATYFEEVLLDHDVHSNWGNWCAAAGMTGGRVNRFNIGKQSKDYDYDGDYLRHWLPELTNVPSPLIHEPWKMNKDQQQQYDCRLGVDYANPLISPFEPSRGGGGGRGGGRGGSSKSRNHQNKKNGNNNSKRDENPSHWKKGGRKEMKSLPKGEIRMES
jgi:deoxyribodipyrimidine photo-lyase